MYNIVTLKRFDLITVNKINTLRKIEFSIRLIGQVETKDVKEMATEVQME